MRKVHMAIFFFISLPSILFRHRSTFAADVGVLRELLNSLNPSSHSDLYGYFSDYPDCGSWIGVTCDKNERVIAIDWSDQYLEGTIPPLISNLTYLEVLDLSVNYLFGSIPNSVGKLLKLVEIDLSSNYLTGPIPTSIENLTRLEYLNIYSNGLSGTIPNGTRSQNLSYLNMEFNRLSGVIPEGIYKQRRLEYMYLGSNKLYGNISGSVKNLQSLVHLSLRENQLSGSIHGNVLGLKKLTILELSGNYFVGNISSSFNESRYFKVDFSNNCLNKGAGAANVSQKTEEVCDAFCSATQLGGPCGGHGTCSMNDLGNVTCSCENGYSSLGNQLNCTEAIAAVPPPPYFPPPATVPPPSPPGKEPWPAVVIAIFFAVIATVLLGILIYRTRKRKPELVISSTFDKRIRGRFVKCISLKEIEEMTNNFSDDNIIGTGGFGTVYKATGPDGEQWAVKRSKKSTPGSILEFQSEVNFISTVFHKSVMSLRGYCDENGEGILVYDYMANGSLWYRLHQNKSAPPLTFEQRINIAVGTAEGLHYLHDQAKPTIIHRDVKSDNILLNENLEAHVADFGLLKGPLNGVIEDTFRVVGTPGYIDPEYVRLCIVAPSSDVYSFGVVLLELITGLPPVWTERRGAIKVDVQLIKHVNEALDWDVASMVDPKLGIDFSIDAMNSLVALAEKCVSRLGVNRPTMQEICAVLVNIKVSLAKRRGRRAASLKESFSARLPPIAGPSEEAQDSFALPQMSSRWNNIK